MAVTLTGGAKLYIGTTLAIPMISPSVEYDDDVYTLIEKAESLGQLGDESRGVDFTAIEDNRTTTLKGSRNAGVMALVCGRDPSSAGQAALKAAEESKLAYNFKLEFADKLTEGGTNTIQYFRALVMSKRNDLGNVDNVTKINFNLAVQTAITEILAT